MGHYVWWCQTEASCWAKHLTGQSFLPKESSTLDSSFLLDKVLFFGRSLLSQSVPWRGRSPLLANQWFSSKPLFGQSPILCRSSWLDRGLWWVEACCLLKPSLALKLLSRQTRPTGWNHLVGRNSWFNRGLSLVKAPCRAQAPAQAEIASGAKFYV